LVDGSHVALSGAHGFAAPQFLGGPPLHIVDHCSFVGMGGLPKTGRQPQPQGSSQTMQSASMLQGPVLGAGSELATDLAGRALLLEAPESLPVAD